MTPENLNLGLSALPLDETDLLSVADEKTDRKDIPADVYAALKEQGIDPETWVDPLAGVDVTQLSDVDIINLLPPAPRRNRVTMTIGDIVATEEWNLPYNEFTHERKVFGMNLPNFQRGLKWSHEQESSYIESVLRDLPTGSFMLTKVEGAGDNPLRGLLIDGQQRSTTLQRFLKDEVEIAGGIVFSQFSRESRAFFLNKPIDVVLLDPQFYDFEALHEIYVKFNYGGTVHDAAERETQWATAIRDIVFDPDNNRITVTDGIGLLDFDLDALTLGGQLVDAGVAVDDAEDDDLASAFLLMAGAGGGEQDAGPDAVPDAVPEVPETNAENWTFNHPQQDD